MVKRGDGGDDPSRKRPAQTLDLEASEVKGAASPEGGEKKPAGGPKTADKDGEDKNAKKAAQHTAGDAASSIASSGRPSDKSSRRSGGGGFFKTLVAGFFGAGLALGGQFFLEKKGLLSGGGDDDVAGQVARLQEQIDGLNMTDLTTRVGDLAAKVETTRPEGGVVDRLKEVEATLKDLSAVASTDDGGLEGLAALALKVNQLERQLSAAAAAQARRGDQGLSEAAQKEVSALSRVVAKQESLAQVEGVKLTADQLGRQLAKVQARAAQLAQTVEGVAGDLRDMRQNNVSKLLLDQELLKFKTELSQLQSVTAELKERERVAHEAARRSALTLAFANLKRAMSEGRSFLSELEAVQRLAPKNDLPANDIAVLARLANEGVANEQQLLKDFPDLAGKAMAQETRENSSSNWDQLLGKARQAFRYRRTGDVQGDSTEAVLARMEHKFKAGQVEAVIDEADALGPQARAVVADWVEKVKARLVVEQALFKLEDQLLTGLQPR